MRSDFKIIHVVLGKANPKRMNGVNVVAHNLCENLREMGCDVELWGITKTENKQTTNRSYKLKLFKANKTRFLLDDKLVTAIKKESESKVLFHFHGGFIVEFYSLSRILTKYGLPYIVTPHGAYNKLAVRRNHLTKSIYFRLFESNLVKNAASIHMLGQSELTGLSLLTDEFLHFFLPNGSADIKKTRDQPVNAKLKIGYCGRIKIDEKGLDLMVEAMTIVNHKVLKAELMIIGDGPDMFALQKKVAQIKASEFVTFYGAKFGSDKYRILGQSDVFIHTSRNEGMPMSVLEAAALGIPLIVSEETNMGKQVLDYNSGIVLKDNVPEEIARAIHKMVEGHSLANLDKIGQNAIDMMSNEFEWTVIAERLHDEYIELFGVTV
jgi:glycosyltransferase involved in cell wall biosynthesis